MNEDDDSRYDYELARFVFDLRKEDPVRMIVRAQAHIDYALRQFVLANAPSPKHVGQQELTFEGIVRLALVLGLNSDIKPALNALSALQTKFARNIDMEFGSQEADNFYSVLGPTLKGILSEVYGEFRLAENLGHFKRQPPATRLVWFLVGIWSAIYSDRKNGPISRECPATEFPFGYVEDIEQRRSNFFRLLEAGDDFELVVRGHSYLDHELREFVKAAAGQLVAVRLEDYDYAGSLRLALILGLDATLETGLSAVGVLRNRFAHRYDAELTEADAKNVYERLDADRRADAQQAWATTFQKHPHSGRLANLLNAKPRDLVAASMAMLFGGVLLQQLKRRTATLRCAARECSPADVGNNKK
jgi:hypothetical protein